MSCTKCSEKFYLSSESGVAFFISEFEELIEKNY